MRIYRCRHQRQLSLVCNSICLSPLLAPVETPCNHVFCERCLGPALAQKQQCPQW
jgi:ligand of Numb protein X 1/2